MPSKISKPKTNAKKTAPVKTNVKRKTTTKFSAFNKNLEITPPSFQSTTNSEIARNKSCCNRKDKKKYPIIGLALIAMLVTIIALIWIINDSQKQFEKFSIDKIEEKIPKANDVIVLPKIVSDTPLATGVFYITGQPWSPDGNKIYLAENGPNMEIGLPEYITYHIFDFTTNTTSPTGIKNGLEDLPPIWQENNSLLANKSIYDLADLSKVVSEKVAPVNLEGFELLDEVIYVNKNDDSKINDVENLSISPNGKWAAFLSAYGSEDIFPSYTISLFVLPKDAKSLDELINFGPVASGVETTPRPLVWSNNSQYLISGKNEIFDVKNNKTVLPRETDSYRRRLTYLSPDQTQALVISNFQDKTDQGDYLHEQVRVYLLDLISGSETSIVSFESANEALNRIDGSYSFDGRHIAYNYQGQLWLAETKTGKTKQLTTVEKIYSSPRFSPDSTKILYYIPNQNIGLIKLNWQ